MRAAADRPGAGSRCTDSSTASASRRRRLRTCGGCGSHATARCASCPPPPSAARCARSSLTASGGAGASAPGGRCRHDGCDHGRLNWRRMSSDDVYDLYQRGTELLEAGHNHQAAVPLSRARDLAPTRPRSARHWAAPCSGPGATNRRHASFRPWSIARRPTTSRCSAWGALCSRWAVTRRRAARSRWQRACSPHAGTTGCIATALELAQLKIRTRAAHARPGRPEHVPAGAGAHVRRPTKGDSSGAPVLPSGAKACRAGTLPGGVPEVGASPLFLWRRPV